MPYPTPWLTISLPLAKLLLQLALLGGVCVGAYQRWLKHGPAGGLLKGLFITLATLTLLWGGSKALQFKLLELVLGSSIQLLLFGLLVIFQPELRKGLVYLGQHKWLNLGMGQDEAPLSLATVEHPQWEASQAIALLVETVRLLAKSRTGALLVLEQEPNAQVIEHYLEQGTRLNAQLSPELLLTIFHPNTPLHDGALVLTQHWSLWAAGVLLPLTEDPNLSWRYGTRHRAALGLSEQCSSCCVVVSEETGSISWVQAGKITKLANHTELAERLQALYPQEPALPLNHKLSETKHPLRSSIATLREEGHHALSQKTNPKQAMALNKEERVPFGALAKRWLGSLL